MKRLLILIVLFITGCAPKGALVAAPEGLEAAVKDFLSKGDEYATYSLNGLNVRSYPNDYYLVVVDVKASAKPGLDDLVARKAESVQSKTLLAQKATKDSGEYWQVLQATKENLKLRGIEPD